MLSLTIIFNLIIPKVLLTSAYPRGRKPNAHKLLTRQIFDAGVQVIVNIMETEELKDLYHIEILFNREIEFISFPIRDRSVHQDNQFVLDFCLELCDRVKRRQVALVHCW
ncbi:unnamed protein product [Didymodactylos carnosus]|uniref:Tyrosine-protein phosphatase domain-containing protein n=1 Tax=Didymodactylos carnosus TaxID=1234261 RepID=A0A815S4N4_9BILA|nr:unnamed protein product [Didymodactylos carnosus]CAF4350121.1 unnamed protein product [Didymodactylos carnosus]